MVIELGILEGNMEYNGDLYNGSRMGFSLGLLIR